MNIARIDYVFETDLPRSVPVKRNWEDTDPGTQTYSDNWVDEKAFIRGPRSGKER